MAWESMAARPLSLCPLAPVRLYFRGTVNACGPRVRYAISSGNAIPGHVPVVNRLTRLDEALA